MIEEWRPVLGYEGQYEVSNLGRVRSLDRVLSVTGQRDRLNKGRMLRPGIGSTGYYLVSLALNGISKTHKIHRLVALAFVDGYKPGLIVCHRDNNSLNNEAINLRWGTYESNSLDAVESGTWCNQNSVRTHCKTGHPLAGDNLYIRPNGNRTCRECARIRKRRYRKEGR